MKDQKHGKVEKDEIENKFPCEKCSKEFVLMDELFDHFYAVHGRKKSNEKSVDTEKKEPIRKINEVGKKKINISENLKSSKLPEELFEKNESVSNRSEEKSKKIKKSKKSLPQTMNKEISTKEKNLTKTHRVKNHANGKVPCPENCGKLLSSEFAIKKHILSHRPETEWPYVCLFCGKHLQARSDLPKHFQTNQHKYDIRIPEQGTPEFEDLMKRSEVN